MTLPVTAAKKLFICVGQSKIFLDLKAFLGPFKYTRFIIYFKAGKTVGTLCNTAAQESVAILHYSLPPIHYESAVNYVTFLADVESQRCFV